MSDDQMLEDPIEAASSALRRYERLTKQMWEVIERLQKENEVLHDLARRGLAVAKRATGELGEG